MRFVASAASAFLLAATPAGAQTAEPAPYTHAIAAGYKALTLCSAMFIAGRSQRDVEALELTGIYPELGPIVSRLPAQVDRPRATVSVAFDPTLPPRIARFVAMRGCTVAPIGTAANDSFQQSVIPAERTKALDLPRGRAPGALPTRLTAALDGASYGAGTRTTGVVVLHDGRIVGERYATGFGPHVANRTWSVAKSIAGTLVGMAAMQGAIDPAAPAPIAEWARDARSAITMDQLLRMASGLHSATAGNRTDAIYFGGTTVDQEAVAWPLEAAPGSRFRYANNDTLLAVLSLRRALGEDRYAALPGRLFATLGMADTIAERDWSGNYILSSQVWSTPRDLARLGELWRNDGVWQGQRLLPTGWVATMTRPSGPQPARGPGYGATLWLFGPEQGLPAGSFAAQGNRGQYVMVVPSRRLVVVRRGEDATNARFDIARFAADVASIFESDGTRLSSSSR